MLAGRAGHGAEISSRMGNAALATGTESGRGGSGCGIGAPHRVADAGLRSAVPGRNGGMAARYFGTAQCAGAYGHWADSGVCFLLWGEPGLRLGGVALAGWATLLQSSPPSAFGRGETGSAGVRLWPSAGGSEALVICRSRVLGGFGVLDRRCGVPGTGRA